MTTDNKIPRTVGECMTQNPTVVEADLSTAEALSAMEEIGIRHLPVVKAGRLVGVISDRDISQAGLDTETRGLSVEEVMSKSPYHVNENTDLGQVLETMAGNRLGCVIVEGAGNPVKGIFTAIDAIRLASRLLKA